MASVLSRFPMSSGVLEHMQVPLWTSGDWLEMAMGVKVTANNKQEPFYICGFYGIYNTSRKLF